MNHGVCIFWFDNSTAIMDEPELLNHTGIVYLINDEQITDKSDDKEQIKAYIIKRIEEIKAIKVDDKLKTMEQDFE